MSGYFDRLRGEWVTGNMHRCNACGHEMAYMRGGGIMGICLMQGKTMCKGEYRRMTSPPGLVAVAKEEPV